MLHAVELPAGFRLAQRGFDVFANFAGDSTSDEAAYQQDDCIEADVGLRYRRGMAGRGRNPAEINRSGDIAACRGDSSKPADPGIKPEN